MKHTATTSPASFNLATLAPAIAAALPGTWTASAVEQYPRSEGECTLTRADGLALYLVAGGYGKAGRITVRHSRPRDARGQWVEVWGDTAKGENPGSIAAPEITVSQTKSAEAIAADIARRLLPDAESVETKARASIARANAYQAGRVALLRAVCEAAGVETPDVGKDERDRAFSVDIYTSPAERTAYRPTARAEVRGEYVAVTVDAHSAAKARALIAFLRSPAYLNA